MLYIIDHHHSLNIFNWFNALDIPLSASSSKNWTVDKEGVGCRVDKTNYFLPFPVIASYPIWFHHSYPYSFAPKDIYRSAKKRANKNSLITAIIITWIHTLRPCECRHSPRNRPRSRQTVSQSSTVVLLLTSIPEVAPIPMHFIPSLFSYDWHKNGSSNGEFSILLYTQMFYSDYAVVTTLVYCWLATANSSSSRNIN